MNFSVYNSSLLTFSKICFLTFPSSILDGVGKRQVGLDRNVCLLSFKATYAGVFARLLVLKSFLRTEVVVVCA